MADATCTGCGAGLEAGRSVCGACGALNLAAPVPAPPQMPVPPAAPAPQGGPGPGPGPGFGPAGGFAPAPPAAPPRLPGARGLIVAAVVLVVAAAAAVGVGVLGSDDQGAASTGAATSAPDIGASASTTRPAGEPEPGSAVATTAIRPRPARVPVTSTGIRWSMVAQPYTDGRADPGSDLRMETWITEDLAASPPRGEAVFSFIAGERPVPIERCLRYALEQNGGEVIEGPTPLTIAGREGSMMLGTMHNGDIEGYVRLAAVPLEDRTVVFLVAVNGTDRAEGEQPFADLIASIQVP